jgi:signal transduction histidine kinase/CheY-like chemotaxis protein
MLIALSDAALRAALAQMLDEPPYETYEAGTGEAVLGALDRQTPDLLLLDAALMDATHRPLLSVLRTHPMRASMAILALTPTPPTDMSILDGADQALPLPPDPVSLRLAVAALLRLKAAEAAARDLLNRRAQDLLALQRITALLAAARTLPDALDAFATALRTHLGYERISVALYDPATELLQSALATTSHGSLVPTPQLPPISLAPASPARSLPPFHALLDQGLDLFFLPDLQDRAPAYFRPFLDGPVRSALVLALRAPDHLAGILTVDSAPSTTGFSPDAVALLRMLAGQAALAFDRVRLAQALDARVSLAETQAQIGATLASSLDPHAMYPRILSSLLDVLPCRMTAVVRFEQEWITVEAVAGRAGVHEGDRLLRLDLASRIWRPGARDSLSYLPETQAEASWQVVPLLEAGQQPGSIIVAPLRADQTVVGLLVLAAAQRGAFEPHHLQFVTAVVERINLAVRTAQLYAAEQQRARVAEELARLRNDFVASVSHELRTPLTAIVGFSQMLQDRWQQVGDRERTAWIEKIAQAAGRQQRLVEDLLLLSRMETGEFEPQMTRSALRALCIQAANEVESLYPGQRIDLVGPDSVQVLGDPDRTVQILTNLMDNAAKYSPEGSSMLVWWGSEGEMGVVRVLDRGPGISRQGRDVLFTRFGRIPGSTIRAGRVGTGLGLYIARGLARAMGGDVELESTGPEGSTFVVRLPLATSDARASETPSDLGKMSA